MPAQTNTEPVDVFPEDLIECTGCPDKFHAVELHHYDDGVMRGDYCTECLAMIEYWKDNSLHVYSREAQEAATK